MGLLRKLSLIISVYNKANFLNFIFTALKNQTFKDFEVIISDDGSGDEIKNLITDWTKLDLFPIIHSYQENKGFRKNKILNKSVLKCNTEYVVFIDGDCIPHHKFLEEHYANKESNTVLCGRRVYFGKEKTENLKISDIDSKKFENISFDMIISSFKRNQTDTYSVEEGFYIKNNFIRNLIINKDPNILGSNFSLEKKLLMAVNGFDENYEGPGIGEDQDIEWRLRLYGAKMKSIKNLAIQYHLYHPKTIEESKNYNYFQNIKKTTGFFCKNGIVKNEN